MKRSEIKDIVSRWMFPPEKTSYMGGIEDAPVLAQSHGSTVVDTDGKEYLDFSPARWAPRSGISTRASSRRSNGPLNP